jgi:hypothetical protein
MKSAADKEFFGMPDRDRSCKRCGKKHLCAFVWLELDTYTGKYHEPGSLPPDGLSQGLFAFGAQCAKAQINADHGLPKRKVQP